VTASSAGAAVSNGHDVTSYDSGMCQKYVRDQCWRVPSLYGSAIEAWNGAREKHPGDRTPPNGAPVYYAGGQYGHAVIYCHGGIRSTDCQSAGRVTDTDLDWPVRNWGFEYLGWTGDINGVDLPLEGEDDVSKQDVIDALKSEAGQDAIRDAVWRYMTTDANDGDQINTLNLVRYAHSNTVTIKENTAG
jgi:hypothetical protein